MKSSIHSLRHRAGIVLALCALAMSAMPRVVAYRCLVMGTVAVAPCCKHVAEPDSERAGATLGAAVCCERIASAVATPQAVREPAPAHVPAPLAIVDASPAVFAVADAAVSRLSAVWLRAGPRDTRRRIPTVVLRV